MVSSIISAKSNNKGISGVIGNTNSDNGFGGTILAIQAGYSYEWEDVTHFNIADEIKAIEYAVAKGADVINMSLSGTTYNSSLQNKITDARNSGIVIVAAAGNFGNTSASYPADYDGVISVIALNQDDTRLSISSYGTNKDISAPGSNILACKPGNQYGVDSAGGTSYAAPIVAATAAIMKGLCPDITPAENEDGLKVTATDIGAAGVDAQTSNGRVDVGLAAQRAVYKSYYSIVPQIQECVADTSGGIKIKWKRIANEPTVSIYRATSRNGEYTKIANRGMTSSSARAYYDYDVEAGRTCYYKIRPRSPYGDSTKYGEYSAVVSCTAS